MFFFAFSSAILSSNRLLYIWAVNNNHVIEASLGYFINPLVSVLIGCMILGEVLSRGQLLAITLALCGVSWLTWQAGCIPWIALGLTVSFAIYGLLRKIARLPSLEGLALETFIISPLALAAGLLWFESHGEGSFGHDIWWVNMMLIGSGIATTIPLLCFASSARWLTLTTMGLLQYLAPTTQLILGI